MVKECHVADRPVILKLHIFNFSVSNLHVLYLCSATDISICYFIQIFDSIYISKTC